MLLPQTPLSNKKWIEPQDLNEETLIRYPVIENKLDIYKRFLNPANCKPKKERLSELTLMMLQLVEGQKGVCVLPKWLLQTLLDFANLPTIKLGKTGLWSTLYAATHQKNQQQIYLENFIEKIQGSQQG